jgi:hypothetical protein
MTPRFLLRHLLPLLVVGLFVAGLVGCDSSSDNDAAAAAAGGLSGDWKITQTYSTGISDTIEVKITQDGNNIGGSFSQWPLVGSISGTDLEFTITLRVAAGPPDTLFVPSTNRDKLFKGVVIDDNVLAGTFEERLSGKHDSEGSWVANRF